MGNQWYSISRLSMPEFTHGTQNPMPPSAGPGDPCMAPKQHNGVPVPTPSNADSGHGRLTSLDLRNPLESGIRSSRCQPPPLLGRGRSYGSFAARLGIRLPRPPRSETKLFRSSILRVRDPAAAPDWLLGASPLPCRGRNRGARLLCAQWWARSCDRSDTERLARPMGRGDGGAAGGTRVDTNSD